MHSCCRCSCLLGLHGMLSCTPAHAARPGRLQGALTPAPVMPQATHDGRTTCAYRISQEGLPLLLPHLTRQRISISAAEALRLVTEMSVPLPPELRIATRVRHGCVAALQPRARGAGVMACAKRVFGVKKRGKKRN